MVEKEDVAEKEEPEFPVVAEGEGVAEIAVSEPEAEKALESKVEEPEITVSELVTVAKEIPAGDATEEVTVSEPVIPEEIDVTTESAEIESETVAHKGQIVKVTVPETLEVTAEEDRDLVPVSEPAETAGVSEEQETEVSVSEPEVKTTDEAVTTEIEPELAEIEEGEVEVTLTDKSEVAEKEAEIPAVAEKEGVAEIAVSEPETEKASESKVGEPEITMTELETEVAEEIPAGDATEEVTVSEPVISEDIEVTTESAEIESETVAHGGKEGKVFESLEGVTADEARGFVPVSEVDTFKPKVGASGLFELATDYARNVELSIDEIPRDLFAVGAVLESIQVPDSKTLFDSSAESPSQSSTVLESMPVELFDICRKEDTESLPVSTKTLDTGKCALSFENLVFKDDHQPTSEGKVSSDLSSMEQSHDNMAASIETKCPEDVGATASSEEPVVSSYHSRERAGSSLSPEFTPGCEVFEEVLSDGSTVKRKLVKSCVKRLVFRKIRKVCPDGRIVEQVTTEEMPESDLSPIESIRSDIESFTEEVLSRPTSSSSPTELFPLRFGVRMYTDTIEGEPQIEKHFEEYKETLADGRIVLRKVVRTRQRQTIIKRIVVEGPRTEETTQILLSDPSDTDPSNKERSEPTSKSDVSHAKESEQEKKDSVKKDLVDSASESKSGCVDSSMSISGEPDGNSSDENMAAIVSERRLSFTSLDELERVSKSPEDSDILKKAQIDDISSPVGDISDEDIEDLPFNDIPKLETYPQDMSMINIPKDSSESTNIAEPCHSDDDSKSIEEHELPSPSDYTLVADESLERESTAGLKSPGEIKYTQFCHQPPETKDTVNAGNLNIS